MKPTLAARDAAVTGDAIELVAGLPLGDAVMTGEAAGEAAACGDGEAVEIAAATVGDAAGVAMVPTGAIVGAVAVAPPQAVSNNSGATPVTQPCRAARREIRAG